MMSAGDYQSSLNYRVHIYRKLVLIEFQKNIATESE